MTPVSPTPASRLPPPPPPAASGISSAPPARPAGTFLIPPHSASAPHSACGISSAPRAPSTGPFLIPHGVTFRAPIRKRAEQGGRAAGSDPASGGDCLSIAAPAARARPDRSPEPGSEGLLASAPGRKCSSSPCWIGSAPRTRRIRNAPGARVGGAFLIPGRGAVALGGARVARSRRRSPRCGMKGVPKRHRRGLFLIWLEGWARWRDQKWAARGGGRCGIDPGHGTGTGTAPAPARVRDGAGRGCARGSKVRAR